MVNRDSAVVQTYVYQLSTGQWLPCHLDSAAVAITAAGGYTDTATVDVPLSGQSGLPRAWPNPARNSLNIEFEPLAHRGRLSVYDVSGRLLVSTNTPRSGRLAWDLRTRHGDRVRPGVYFWELRTPFRSIRRPFVIVQ